MIFKYCALLLLLSPLLCFAQDWKALNDEGMRSYQQGEYEKAIQLFSRALQSTTKEKSDYTTSLTNLGYCYQALANYPEAQNAFRESLRLTHRQYAPLHIEQIDAVLNLANAFLPSGQYDSCEYYLYVAEKWLNENVALKNAHYQDALFSFFDAAINMHNTMASLAYKKGQPKKAAALMEQQLYDIKKMYPDGYQTLFIYSSTLNNLSTYCIEAGDFKKAGLVAREQLAIIPPEQKNKLQYLYAQNNLASTYRYLEQYDSAIFIYAQVATVLDTGAYRGSDLHIAVLNNQGELLYALEDYPRAILTLHESVDLQEKRPGVNPRIYQTTLLTLSEAYHWSGDFRQAELTYRRLTEALTDEILHSYTYLSDAEKISFFRSNIFALQYFSSFAFELSGDLKLLKTPVNHQSKSGLNDLFDLLIATKGIILHPGLRMKNSILGGTNGEIKLKYQQWEDKKYAYATETRREQATVKTISALSLEIEALEKWLRIHSPAFQKGFVMERKSWRDVQQSLSPDEAAVEVVRLADGLVYGVLILTSQTTDGPVATLVKSKYPQFLEKQLYRNYANAIRYELTDTTSYKIFWKPIAEAINKTSKGKQIQRIYFSGDGIYNKINLNTLYDASTENYLIGQAEIVHVTNMKEVISKKENSITDAKKAVLFGRPRFYAPGKEQSMDISDLPGTEREVDQIDSIFKKKGWNTKLYKHEKANEASVKQLQSPQVLHFATHGFVVQDTLRNDLADVMLNAGIMLADAGSRNTTGEDGVLTAYELMNVNLDNTDLTVLSACETGLGGYYQGEGVYGLQRAIRSAGSKNTIMSLWKVDDTATQKLMKLFYSNWLGRNKNVREAFRQAQLELMKTYPQPKYWGAFIFGGK